MPKRPKYDPGPIWPITQNMINLKIVNHSCNKIISLTASETSVTDQSIHNMGASYYAIHAAISAIISIITALIDFYIWTSSKHAKKQMNTIIYYSLIQRGLIGSIIEFFSAISEIQCFESVLLGQQALLLIIDLILFTTIAVNHYLGFMWGKYEKYHENPDVLLAVKLSLLSVIILPPVFLTSKILYSSCRNIENSIYNIHHVVIIPVIVVAYAIFGHILYMVRKSDPDDNLEQKIRSVSTSLLLTSIYFIMTLPDVLLLTFYYRTEWTLVLDVLTLCWPLVVSIILICLVPDMKSAVLKTNAVVRWKCGGVLKRSDMVLLEDATETVVYKRSTLEEQVDVFERNVN